jgi:hypothetical protein
VLVVSTPRSASTSVAEEIADNRCSISFNEMFANKRGCIFSPQGANPDSRNCLYTSSPDGGETCGRLPNGGCEGTVWKSRGYKMLEALRKMRHMWCLRPDNNGGVPAAACSGQCVVAVKIFQGMARSVAALTELIQYPGSRVVVVKRDPDTEECSLNYSLASGVWHHIDKVKEHAWQAQNCRAHASPQFVRQHTQWYDFVYGILKNLNKRYLDLPFEEFVSDVPAARSTLHEQAKLPQDPEFQQPWCHKTPGAEMAGQLPPQ